MPRFHLATPKNIRAYFFSVAVTCCHKSNHFHQEYSFNLTEIRVTIFAENERRVECRYSRKGRRDGRLDYAADEVKR